MKIKWRSKTSNFYLGTGHKIQILFYKRFFWNIQRNKILFQIKFYYLGFAKYLFTSMNTSLKGSKQRNMIGLHLSYCLLFTTSVIAFDENDAVKSKKPVLLNIVLQIDDDLTTVSQSTIFCTSNTFLFFHIAHCFTWYLGT